MTELTNNTIERKSGYSILYSKVNRIIPWNNVVDFDIFLNMMEDWFIFIGAVKFLSDKEHRSIVSMTEDEWKGFHEIIKSLFYENNFQVACNLIEEGKEKYQDMEASILDMNVDGKFLQSGMQQKSEALEKSKELYLSFSKILSDFSPNVGMENVLNALNHILSIFDVLKHITIDFELKEVKPHIHSIFGWIINTNMFDNFLKILELRDDKDVSVAKITTLKILCHISLGLQFFNNVNEELFALIPDEGYFTILSDKLGDAELLIRVRDWLSSDWVEVVEQACITLGYFVKNNLDLRKALEDYGIMNALLKITNLEQVDSINEYSLWCIFNICRKYLPIAEKVVRKQEEDSVFNLAYSIGALLYGMDIQNVSSFAYMTLTWGYLFDHITQYAKELKLLCDKIEELIECENETIVECCLITICKAIHTDSRFISYFNSQTLFSQLQQIILSQSESRLVQKVVRYVLEVSAENLLTFDNKVYTSLYFVHQSQSRSHKSCIVKVFTNIIKNTGTKSLLKHAKDIFRFAFASIDEFKNQSDKIVTSTYHRDIITVDVGYLLTALEFLYNLCQETPQDVVLAEITVDKVGKLEDTIRFFYDWYTQWEDDGVTALSASVHTDSVIEECASILLDVLKDIGNKVVSSHVSGFLKQSPYDAVKDMLQDFVELLENKIYKVSDV